MDSNIEIKDAVHISMVAAANGYRAHKTIWDANSSLKAKRKNPNLLFHGDRVSTGDHLIVPKFDEKPPKPGQTEKHHVFKVEAEKLFLRIRILAENYTAIPKAEFEMTVDDVPTPFKGKTDDKGQIEVEIPRTAMLGTLTVRVPGAASDNPPTGGTATGAPPASGGTPPPASGGGGASATPTTATPVRGPVPCTWTLMIGALGPIMENAPDQWCIAGVQQRLNNLCLNTGPVDGIRGPNTTAAIKAFQTLFGLAADGKPGQGETQPKMVEVHDKPDSILGPRPDPNAASGGSKTT